MKVSIVIPVYFNEDSLRLLYSDLKNKFIDKIDYDYEIVMVNDGSTDNSYSIMTDLASIDNKIKIISLSRNFGSHAAILCGMTHCTGDCAIIKSADLQEPTEMLLEMVESWKNGNNVVLAVRESRNEPMTTTFFADFYYRMVKKVALPQMPEKGFDVFLIDRKVIQVLDALDEKNSSLTGQILWSGFKTERIYYTRLAREIGTSKWTFRKKMRLVLDTLFSFTNLPITVVTAVGILSIIGAILWAVTVLIGKLTGNIPVTGWTTLIIFNLLSFGIIMMTLGILGEYLWRTFDASRNRPLYIIEESNMDN